MFSFDKSGNTISANGNHPINSNTSITSNVGTTISGGRVNEVHGGFGMSHTNVNSSGTTTLHGGVGGVNFGHGSGSGTYGNAGITHCPSGSNVCYNGNAGTSSYGGSSFGGGMSFRF